MRLETSLPSLAAFVAAAFLLVASVLIAADPVLAAEATPAPGLDPGKPSCICPSAADLPKNHAKPWPKPKYAEAPRILDAQDEIAALEAVHLALSEVGDGAAYVWHRYHGQLSGLIQPTSSFKDKTGRICRHLVVMLTSGPVSKRTEAVACRIANGAWQLDG